MGSSRAVRAPCARFVVSDSSHPVSDFSHPVSDFRGAGAAGAVRETDWRFRRRVGTRCVPGQNFGFRFENLGHSPPRGVSRRKHSRHIKLDFMCPECCSPPSTCLSRLGRQSRPPSPPGAFCQRASVEAFLEDTRPFVKTAPARSPSEFRGSDVEAVPIARIGPDFGDLAPCAGGLRGGYGRGSGRETLTWFKSRRF